ncbi:hypothetical protein K466DRAFT_501426 [Polyporus arcularius HHB13444]|uniref:Uncharacterized protein n=1 Tax=Polyporus arcularius HHB13444 TaxID=1314778 RepID=A0A5C3NYG8_9APHY|nr:hypothetical protein K466DRAFT_501426 [Polyporus arcularius HHB13444]
MKAVTLRYVDSDVPETSSLSSVTDIPTLHEMWDDADLGRWQNRSPLVIRGVAIPLEHWATVYRRQYRRIGPCAFWSQYSQKGQRLPMTRILKQLKASRMEKDKELAERALVEHSERFSDHYTYRRGREHRVYTRPRAIAQRFLHLLEQ